MSFLSELRRRNVFKVAVAYAVVSWLIIQVASVVEGPLALPAWFDTAVIVLLALGFPVALLMAWAFELTPEGVRPTVSVKADAEAASAGGGRLNVLIIGALAIAVGFLAFDKLVLGGRSSSADDRLPNSIAVLPFENASPRDEDAWFAIGLHEEILNQLAKIQGLNVMARTTMRQYVDTEKPMTQIAEELNVEAVMEGSVRYADGRIRVTAQLIDGRTGLHQWSETFERDFDDIFAIESNIAITVANEMSVEFSDAERSRIEGIPTENPDAYQLYLQAATQRREQTPEGADACLESINRAVALDPEFGLAWVEKSWCHNLRLLSAPENGLEEREASVRALDRALAINPEFPLIYPSLVFLAASAAEWSDAAAYLRRAIELGANPDEYQALLFRLPVGYLSDAREEAERAYRRDPYESTNTFFLMTVVESLGDSATADAIYARGKTLYTDWPAGQFARSVILLGRGTDAAMDEFRELFPPEADPYRLSLGISLGEDEPARAIAAIRARFDSNPTDVSLVQLPLAAAAAWYGDADLALSALANSTRGFAVNALYLWTPLFDDVRQLGAFREFARERGFVEFWQENGWPNLCEPAGADDFACR